MDIKELPLLVQIVAIVALVAGISAIILDEFQIQQETTTNVTNETITFTALDTDYYLANNVTVTSYWIRLVNSTITVQNSTDGVANRAGNWSVNIANGQIRAITGGVITAGSDWNVTYQYTTGSAARSIYEDGLIGLIEVTSWLDLVALAVMAGILLVIIMGSLGGMFGGNKQGSGETF